MQTEHLQALLNAIPLPALAIGQDERILSANVDARTLIGPQIVGRNYVTMLRQPALLDVIESTLRDKAPRRARYLSNDGAQDTAFDVSCRFAEGVGPGGRGAVMICFDDITDLEKAGQMRRDFVANVSHELRTPLTALMGFVETLRGPARNDAEAAGRFLDIMQGEAERMNRLIGDLLSLNRVESHERVRPTTPVVLNDLLGAVVDTMRPLAAEHGVHFVLDLGDAPVEIIGEPDQLKQVFANLIENAIKYGREQGEVEVALRVYERDPALRGPGVRVHVRDDGPGIDPVHVPRLTERFYRVDDHRSRAMGGTGLGLAIVKHIVNRHRGRLRVESEPAKGSTFTVILPAVAPRRE